MSLSPACSNVTCQLLPSYAVYTSLLEPVFAAGAFCGACICLNTHCRPDRSLQCRADQGESQATLVSKKCLNGVALLQFQYRHERWQSLRSNSRSCRAVFARALCAELASCACKTRWFPLVDLLLTWKQGAGSWPLHNVVNAECCWSIPRILTVPVLTTHTTRNLSSHKHHV